MSEIIDREDLGRVKEIDGKFAIVEMIKSGSCDSCAIHGFCGAGNKAVHHRIKTDIKLQAGDTVQVFIAPELKILSSFILFILPIIVMIGFYFLGKQFLNSEGKVIITSFIGLLLSGLAIFIIDKKFAAKKIKFEILEKV